MKLPEIWTVKTPTGDWKILTSLRSNWRIKNYLIPNNGASQESYWDAFCALQRNDQGVILLWWMYVPEKMRWNWFSHLLQEIALRVCEALWQQPTTTKEINKPGIALLLKKYWFWAEDERNKFLLDKEWMQVGDRVIPKIYRLSGKKTIKANSSLWIPNFQIWELQSWQEWEIIYLWTHYILIDEEILHKRRIQNDQNFSISSIKIS